MAQFDVVKVWLDNVAQSHSKSLSTAYQYPRSLRMFCDFARTTPEQIKEDYQSKDYDERHFKLKYRDLVQAWISSSSSSGKAPGTIADEVKAVKSFFKYNDMPIGFMPRLSTKIMFHNRDIEKEEIQAVIGVSDPRERAYFAFMAQSGLRPETICALQFEDLEPLDKVPCMIMVPAEKTKGEFGSYFTFIGEDALKYLKDYLATRKKTGPKDYVFMNNKETVQYSANDKEHNFPRSYDRTYPSRYFAEAAQKLKATGKLDYKIKKQGKPAELRLYNLRKYFRRMAGAAGPDYVNFWMGHALPQSSDKHYFPGKGEETPSKQVIEHHRQLYAEKAMPFLRLESASPTETEKTIEKLVAENKALRETMENKISPFELQMAALQKQIEDLQKQITSDKEKTSET